ncbi:response regulator [Methylobacterium planeticum]|uniref:histidine kinase n=1 Tax=Methylobacterium planeticum TaxID=2615211 RepID=A0A6N6MUA2_9HYPH|nr:response regulator [Methylobacterium planeticum]KAB1073992.1 response regulator [Methylobacterium planeticum]
MNGYRAGSAAGEAASAEPREADAQIRAKILIADDDRRNLLAVSEILDEPGLELVLVESGEDALRHTLRDDFALILLDVQMPTMDGYEVATLIRSRSRSSRVPILFLTAYNKEDVHVFRGYSAGAVDYVFKPIQPLILKSKVDVFVDLYRKAEEIKQKAAAEKALLLENLRVRGEKLEAEQALRRRDEHQTAVLRGLPIALYTASPSGPARRLSFTGDGIARITGFGPEAFAGPDFWRSRLNAEDRGRVFEALDAAAGTGAATLEYRWRHADGTERHILDQVVIKPAEGGGSADVFGMWFDVTERKELELSLQHASKLEAVGRLTGGIAHDFNNMLSIVIGNLDLLQRAVGPDEKASRRVESAIGAAERCAELTSRLLTFSRRSPLQPAPLDFATFMPGLLKLLKRTLSERVEASLVLEDDVPMICVDHAQLEAALINLAVNARDAMPEGGALSIRVQRSDASASSEAAPDGFVQIAVADTGTGMPAAVLERVFEPFFTTKEQGKGTGLGLSMVHGFVQQSGGRIQVESLPGHGTTITLALPILVAGEAADPGAPDPCCPQDMHGEGRTVLVVEDDADVRQVATSALEMLAFQVKEARDGAEAIAILEQDSEVALVFSDVNMPGTMNGIELGRIVKERWPGIDVLLTSGYLKDDQDVGDLRMLQKPYRASELVEKLLAFEAMTAESGRAARRRAVGTSSA